MTERWVIGGVAAELATRLHASAAFIRVLLIVAVVLQPSGTFAAYGAAAVLLPRGGARWPRWSGLVAGARFGALLLVPLILSAGGLSLEDTFSSGPAVWVPLGSVAAAVAIGVLAWRPRVDEIDESRCRTLVLGALPVAAVAAGVAGGIALAPEVRWERVLAGSVVVLAAALAVLAPRHRGAAAALVPGAALGLATLILAGAGARLDGGVGDLVVVPREDGVVEARRAVGDVVVDLSALPRDASEVTVRASTGVGQVDIVLPSRADADADVRVGRGTIAVGDHARGIGLHQRLSGGSTARRQTPVRVTILAETAIGEVRISRRPGGRKGGGI